MKVKWDVSNVVLDPIQVTPDEYKKSVAAVADIFYTFYSQLRQSQILTDSNCSSSTQNTSISASDRLVLERTSS